MAAADLVRGLDALVGLGRRHADVHDGYIGLVEVDRREQLVGVDASATTSIPSLRTKDAMPSRNSRLSSAITTRTGAPR